MRFLLVLLAMLSGLLVPDVAMATSRAEVADMGAPVSGAVQQTQRREACTARGSVAQRLPQVDRRKPVWLPVPAFIRACGIELTDRARE